MKLNAAKCHSMRVTWHQLHKHFLAVHYTIKLWKMFSSQKNLHINQIGKFRVQRPAGPAGDGEKQVVSAKCLMNLNAWPSLEARRDQSHLLHFHKIHCGAVSIEKDKYITHAHSLKTSRSSHCVQYCRYQTYSVALKTLLVPRTIPHWNNLSPMANTNRGVMGTPHLVKTQLKVCPFFFGLGGGGSLKPHSLA